MQTASLPMFAHHKLNWEKAAAVVDALTLAAVRLVPFSRCVFPSEQRGADDQLVLWLSGGSAGLVRARQRLHQGQRGLQPQLPLHFRPEARLYWMCGESSFSAAWWEVSPPEPNFSMQLNARLRLTLIGRNCYFQSDFISCARPFHCMRFHFAQYSLYLLLTTGFIPNIKSQRIFFFSGLATLKMFICITSGHNEQFGRAAATAALWSVPQCRQFDFVTCLRCLRARQRAHYLQVVLSNQQKQQPGLFVSSICSGPQRWRSWYLQNLRAVCWCFVPP